MIFIGQPCCTHQNMPGDTKSFTLSAFALVIMSPGATWAATGPVVSRASAATASELRVRFRMRYPFCGYGAERVVVTREDASRLGNSTPDTPPSLCVSNVRTAKCRSADGV